MNKQVDLSSYNISLKHNVSFWKRILWFLVNAFFFQTSFFVFYKAKIYLLRVFGAKIGNGVIIKPSVNIKYPWKLKIGNNSWIGEGVWIDNLDDVMIGNNVCISQGALLISGNHDYTKSGFDLIIKPILIHDGVWIGTRAIVCGGSVAYTHAVLTAGSVTSGELLQYSIYKGNPAVKIKDRVICD